MAYSATNWPPMQLPSVTSSSKIGETVENLDAPPGQITQPTPRNITWPAAAAAPNTQAVRSTVTTQQAINDFFGIVDLRLDGQAP